MHGVSVIIPTFNRESLLAATLDSIFKSAPPVPTLETIIVNDGAPFTKNIPGIERCSVISNHGKGAASARNSGASAAKHPLLLFLDDDMLVAPDNISKHLEL